jgi:hypothetical protein
MRVGDLQQILMQTDTVSQVQQQAAHGAEVEQSRLAARHQEEIKEQENQVPTLEESDTVEIREREARHSRQEQEKDAESGEESETFEDTSSSETSRSSSAPGRHIDIIA